MTHNIDLVRITHKALIYNYCTMQTNKIRSHTLSIIFFNTTVAFIVCNTALV